MRYTNVRGQPGLMKDTVSGAVLNINKNEIAQARQRKKLCLEEKERSDKLETDVYKLKKDMYDIKTLLHKILEVTDGRNND